MGWQGWYEVMKFVSCFSVSIVVSGFSYVAQSLRCLLRKATIDTEKHVTNIIPSLPTHTLSQCAFILICLHTLHNKTKVIR